MPLEPLRYATMIAACAPAMLAKAVGTVTAPCRRSRWNNARMHRTVNAVAAHVNVAIDAADAARVMVCDIWWPRRAGTECT